MKTINEWLKEYLSEEDYKLAQQYNDGSWKREFESFERALFKAFMWPNTIEGYDYWNAISENGGSLQTNNTNKMKVKTRIIDPNLPTPALGYAKPGDAGIDLTATSMAVDEYGNVVYGTNRAFEIPKGYVGLLFPRSSNSKKDLALSNSVGVVDSGYRGEVMMKYRSTIWQGSYGIAKIYEVGDRIGQLIILPYPEIEFEEVENLTETERGSGGYGSTGN